MKTLYNRIPALAKAATLMVAVMALVCCNKELGIDEGPSASLRLMVDVPDVKAPQADENPGFSYDDPLLHEGADNLLQLSDLDFYFFDAVGEYITMASGAKQVSIKSDSYDAVNKFHRYVCDLQVNNILNGQIYRVVVVANKRSTYSTQMPFCVAVSPNPKKPAGYEGTDEQYMYSQLVFDTKSSTTQHNTVIPNYTMWNLDGMDEACVPMWGVQQLTAIVVANPTGEITPSGSISLLRSLAKVKIMFGNDLLNYVKLTDYVPNSTDHGVVMSYSRNQGYMAPAYNDAKAATTWNSKGQDKVSGVYSNAHVNAPGAETISGLPYAMPMFRDTDGSYYTYLPEQKIGEAYMNLEFQYTDPNILTTLKTNKKLQFADYAAAMEARGASYGDVPLTEEQLKDFRFPVMRNHYYIFEIIRIDPLELKFEICNWSERIAPDIIFN